jgi:competence protein ComGF
MIIIGLILLIISYFILDYEKTEKTKLRKIKEYSNFSTEVFNWHNEITDDKAREALLIYHLQEILTGLEDEIKKYERIPEFRNHIETKWGHHIPSLKKEIRDRKIKSILND